jgi:hypothetical protein
MYWLISNSVSMLLRDLQQKCRGGVGRAEPDVFVKNQKAVLIAQLTIRPSKEVACVP